MYLYLLYTGYVLIWIMQENLQLTILDIRCGDTKISSKNLLRKKYFGNILKKNPRLTFLLNESNCLNLASKKLLQTSALIQCHMDYA